MLRNTHSCLAADARDATTGTAAAVAQVGVYLTDEVFLFRVVDVLASGAGETADLEDCYQLDVVRVPIADLRARRLRVVTPARGETATGFTRP
jgi:hypothetical protein